MKNRFVVRIVVILIVAVVAFVARRAGWIDDDAPRTRSATPAEANPASTGGAPTEAASSGSAAIDAAFAARRSGVWVESEGRVVHLLADDNEGSRHQRWLLDIASGLTLKISHNIDLAERLPLEVGDTVRFRGRYEHNDKGGVVHWTHHDPDGRLPGGWLELRGRRYE